MTQLPTPEGASLNCPLRGPILAARGPALWGGDGDVAPAFGPDLLPAPPCSNVLGSDFDPGSTLGLIWPPSPASPTPPRPRTDLPWSRTASVSSFQPKPGPLGLVRPPSPASPTLPWPRSQPRRPRTDPPRPRMTSVSSSQPLPTPLGLVRPPSPAPDRCQLPSALYDLRLQQARLRLGLGPNPIGLGLIPLGLGWPPSPTPDRCQLPSALYGLRLQQAQLCLGLGPNPIGLGIIPLGLERPPSPAPLGLVRPPSPGSPTLPRPLSQPRRPRTDPPRPWTASVSSFRPLPAPLGLIRPPSPAPDHCQLPSVSYDLRLQQARLRLGLSPNLVGL